MRAKNVKDKPGQSIIASIVKDAIKPPQKQHKRHKKHNAVYFYIKTRTEPKVGKVLGEALWAKIKCFIDSNAITKR